MLVAGRAVEEEAIEEEFAQQHQKAIKGAKAPQKKANPNTNTSSEVGVKKSGRKTRAPRKKKTDADEKLKPATPARKRTPAAGVSQAVRDARMKAGECTKCGKKGHFANDCPDNAKDTPAGATDAAVKAVKSAKVKKLTATAEELMNYGRLPDSIDESDGVVSSLMTQPDSYNNISLGVNVIRAGKSGGSWINEMDWEDSPSVAGGFPLSRSDSYVHSIDLISNIDRKSVV